MLLVFPKAVFGQGRDADPSRGTAADSQAHALPSDTDQAKGADDTTRTSADLAASAGAAGESNRPASDAAGAAVAGPVGSAENPAGTSSEARVSPPDESAPAKKKSSEFVDGTEKDNDTEEGAADKKKKKKRKKVEVQGRIHGRWELEPNSTSDKMENRFRLRRANLEVTWNPKKWLTAELQVGGLHKIESGISLLQDAFIHLSPSQYIEVRVGQFKKPFSRLELRSSGKLRVAERGIGNSFIIEDLLYGDRDIGFQLSGRLIPSIKLDYAVGVFNGTGPDIKEIGNAKDVVARIKTTPRQWFETGANGSIKLFDDDAHKERDERMAWAAGVDAVFRFFGARLHLEGIMAQDHQYKGNYPSFTPPMTEMPLTLSGVGIISYEYAFNTSRRLAVEPVFKMEYLDPNLDFIDDYVLLYSPGFNTYIGKYLRLMLHAEIRRGGVNHLQSIRDKETLILQLCLDI